eukprot:scaffold343173_cov55-Attheya_sp.AAC.3
MPTPVTFRVKWGSSLPVNEPAKKQRMTNVPRSRVKSEIVTTVEEVTVKTEEIDDGSIACEPGSSESAFCEPPYNSHLSHMPSTSSTTSNQFTSQVGTSDNAAMCSFESTFESDLDSLSNQDSESPPINNGFSELQCEEEVEYEEVAQNSTAHGPAAIPFVLNYKKKRKYPGWDENFKELVDFKGNNGHTNVPRSSGPLGHLVCNQRRQYHLLKEGKHSPLTSDRRQKLESIGFSFTITPCRPWDERFHEQVDFKKINGHMNVPQGSGPLRSWVSEQ